MATLEETVTREEYDTLLKGLATKGDIKIVVDLIHASENKLSQDIAGLKSDIEELSTAVVRITRHLGIT